MTQNYYIFIIKLLIIFFQNRPRKLICAIHHLAEPMPYVMMAFVLAYQNIKEILISVVDQSVL